MGLDCSFGFDGPLRKYRYRDFRCCQMVIRTTVFTNRGEGSHPPNRRQGSHYRLPFDQVQNHPMDIKTLMNDMSLKELMNFGNFATPSSELPQEKFQQADEGSSNNQIVTTFDDFQPFPVDPATQQQEDWSSYQFTASQQQQLPLPHPIGLFGSGMPMLENSTVTIGFNDSRQMGMQLISVPPLGTGTPSSSDSLAAVATEVKQTDDMADKSVERRKRRMIKNRESAARSRARKQKYIDNLVDQVRELTKSNKRLKKEQEILERQDLEPRNQLRRTSSATF